MMTSALVVPMLAITLVAPAAAESPQQGDYAQAAQTPKPAPPSERETPPQRAMRDAANIRLELTITVTDPRGVALMPAKTTSMHIIDGDHARVRMGHSADSTPPPGNFPPFGTPVLNIDASGNVVNGGRVRAGLSFEYRPGGADAEKMPAIHINERLSAVLENGKPMVVSQTADPGSDRIVKVELKATILK